RIPLGAALLLACGCESATLGGAPSDGRCGATPRLLLDASSYPVSPGATDIYVSALVVDGPDLYYVLTESAPSGTPGYGPDGGATNVRYGQDGGVAGGGGDVIIIPAEPGFLMRVPAAGGQPVQVAGGYAFSAPVFTPSSMILGESAIVDWG